MVLWALVGARLLVVFGLHEMCRLTLGSVSGSTRIIPNRTVGLLQTALSSCRSGCRRGGGIR